METPDYLTYKKLKKQYSVENKTIKKNTKAKFYVRFFFFTFFAFFAIILIIMSNYSKKMDIETDTSFVENNEIVENPTTNETKYSIDTRLTSLYNEEIGLSTARAINREDEKPMDTEHYKQMKNEQIKLFKEDNNKIVRTDDEGNVLPDRTYPIKEETPPKQTKILIGKYQTHEDARIVADQIRKMPEFQELNPYVKQIGNFYSVQVGSYTNLELARMIAEKFQRASYKVYLE